MVIVGVLIMDVKGREMGIYFLSFSVFVLGESINIYFFEVFEDLNVVMYVKYMGQCFCLLG